MAYAAWNTQGTVLKVDISATMTAIPGVEGIEGPDGSKNQVEVTALDDTAAKYVGGLPDFGSISFTLFWDPADTVHQHLYTSYKTANSEDDFNIVCADAGDAVIAFTGFVAAWAWNFTKNAAASARVTVKLSGEPTVTP